MLKKMKDEGRNRNTEKRKEKKRRESVVWLCKEAKKGIIY